MDVGELIAYLLTPIMQVGIIIGLAEMAKKSGLSAKWIPFFDIVVGLFIGIVIYGIAMGYGVVSGLVLGTALGLSACGLFSGIKNFIEK